MLNPEHTREAVDLLSTAIVAMIEDIHPEAVLASLATDHGRSLRFKQVGEDIVALAAAILVLQRQTDVAA